MLFFVLAFTESRESCAFFPLFADGFFAVFEPDSTCALCGALPDTLSSALEAVDVAAFEMPEGFSASAFLRFLVERVCAQPSVLIRSTLQQARAHIYWRRFTNLLPSVYDNAIRFRGCAIFGNAFNECSSLFAACQLDVN